MVMICECRAELLASFVLACSSADAKGLHDRRERERERAMHAGEISTDGVRQRRYHFPALYLRRVQQCRGDRQGDGLPGGDDGAVTVVPIVALTLIQQSVVAN